MGYRKFVFVVHIEFSIGTPIKDSGITISSYATRNDTTVYIVRYRDKSCLWRNHGSSYNHTF